MKSFLLALCVLLVAPFVRAQQTTAPALQYHSVPDFFKLPPGQNFGEVPGIAVDSKGNVYVFTRSNSANGPAYGAAAAQLLEFNSKGEYMREIGKGLYAWSEAHSVRIDKDDNIWAVDKGSDMVIKFNQAGRVLWVFGRKKEAADGPTPWGHPMPPLPPVDGMFRQPTDVTWDSNGNIYISDGYVNSRIAKYDKHGDWVKSWGEYGTGPGQFRLPHQVQADNKDELYVGDRSNHRVQVFDTDGKFLRMFEIDITPDPETKAVDGVTPTGDRLKQAIGAPNSICMTKGANQVMYIGESTYPGRVFKVAMDGTVLGVIGRSGRELGEFSGAHGLACPNENEVFVAESSNWRAQKLIIGSGAGASAAKPAAGKTAAKPSGN